MGFLKMEPNTLSERSCDPGWTGSLILQARETLMLVGLCTSENSLLRSGWLGRNSGLLPHSALIEIIQVQHFYADITSGLGESSCCPVLVKFLAHSAQLLLPRENWWVLFRLFAGLDSPSVADHCPSPGRGVLSIMTRYCCWYFIYYQFFITENHFI